VSWNRIECSSTETDQDLPSTDSDLTSHKATTYHVQSGVTGRVGYEPIRAWQNHRAIATYGKFVLYFFLVYRALLLLSRPRDWILGGVPAKLCA
jgi:hypothetical protein